MGQRSHNASAALNALPYEARVWLLDLAKRLEELDRLKDDTTMPDSTRQAGDAQRYANPGPVLNVNTIVTADLTVTDTFDMAAGTIANANITNLQGNQVTFTDLSVDSGGVIVVGPGAALEISGAFRLPYVQKTGTYLVTVNDCFIEATSGTWTLNLPARATVFRQPFVLINSGAGIITIDPNGAETINGAATLAVLAGTTARFIAGTTEFRTW
jgi:hypothetical protein